jgi:dihydroorotate dehydrogenase
LFPQALHAVQRLQRLPAPLIAGCGVYRLSDGLALLDAGAWAVQLDLALWAIETTQFA